MAGKVKILVTDAIDQEGLAPLKSHPGMDLRYELAPKPEQLIKLLDHVEAWLVRSETKVNKAWIEKAPGLRLIGRAGVGVDNIDLEAATHRGIAVINAPAANTIAAAEHSMALILSLARNVPHANADVKAGKWQRSKWMGSELQGKVLGLAGFGRIGREVAKRAQSFGMDVLAFDPFVSKEQAQGLGVRLAASVKELVSLSDFISLHAPASEKTRHMINKESLGWMKPGARLVNCARGDLVEEAALVEALESGRLAGAALDVFAAEPLPVESRLRGLANVILTPHLGASTQEAQEKVARELSQGVIDFFEKGIAANAINLPGVDAETWASLGGWLDLADKLGRFAGQMIDSGLKEFACTFSGDFRPQERRPLAIAALKGCLSTMLAQPVNAINASTLAAERGIQTSEAANPKAADGFKRLLTVTAVSEKGPMEVAGALVSDEPRIMRLGKLPVEVRLQGKMIVLTNQDRPGVIGRVGFLLGENKINIADMRVGRTSAHGEAVMVLTVDEEATPELQKELEKIDGITKVRCVQL